MKKILFCMTCLVLFIFSMLFQGEIGKAESQDEWNAALVNSYRKSDELKTSGIYSYRVLDEGKKEIEIREIRTEQKKIEIPATLDGYRVLSIGYCGSLLTDIIYYNILADALRLGSGIKDTLEEIVIPEGVREIGSGAFQNFTQLQKVIFPKKGLSYIREYAFYGCNKLDNLKIPKDVSVGKRSFSECKTLNSIILNGCRCWESLGDKADTLVIYPNSNGFFSLYNAFDSKWNHIKRVNVVPKVSKLVLDSWNYHKIDKLIINGKNTKIDFEPQYKKNSNIKWLGTIYTVPKAKAINFARKYKTTYKVKRVQKDITVTRVKKGSKYHVFWKNGTTQIKTYSYDGGWDSQTVLKKTKYKLYAKKSRKGKYKLVKTTSKHSAIIPYQYAKVVPVSTW